MKFQIQLHSIPRIAVIALVGLSTSCEKIHKLTSQIDKKKPAAAAATKPQEADMPQAIRDLVPAGASRIVMVDFYADWCGPCRMLSPTLEKIADEHPGVVQVCKINVDQHHDVSSQEGVKGIPDVRIYLDGKLMSKFVGALPEAEVRKRIDDLLQQLPPPATAAADTPAAPAAPKEPVIKPMTKDWLPPGIQRR